MAIVRRIARPLLAAPFVFEGVRTAISPEREIDVVPEGFEAVDSALEKSGAPGFVDVRTIVRATGVVAAGAGILYAAGKKPRAAAAVLLLSTSVGLAGRKRVWELKGAERTREIQSILTDTGLLGGLMLAAVDTDGRPSLGYRATKLVERGQKNAQKKQRELEKKAQDTSRAASKKGRSVERKANRAVGQAQAKIASVRG